MSHPVLAMVQGEEDPTIRFVGLRTSSKSALYNCVAWAFRLPLRNYWPSSREDWPVELAANDHYGLQSFEALFKAWNWSVCESRDYEEGFDKIAFYVDGSSAPTHVARIVHRDDGHGEQSVGLWSSKIGADIDALHTLETLEGSALFGQVRSIYRKPR